MMTEEEVTWWQVRLRAAYEASATERSDGAVSATEADQYRNVLRTATAVRLVDIMQCIESGMRQKDIGAKWGISASRVGNIATGVRRKERERAERAAEREAWLARQELEKQEAAAKCPPRFDPVYAIGLDHGEFSTRAINALRATGLKYAWELAETPTTVLAKLPNVGRKTLREFEDFLAELKEKANDHT